MTRTFVKRVGPGLNMLRVEALQPDTRRAARAQARLQGELSAGFGMSDILLGTSPTPRGGVDPKSWRDIQVTPVSGTFQSPQIGLVWEIYELTARDKESKYRIEVTVERVSKGLGGFTARLVDNLGRTVGRESSGLNRLSVSFDRTAPESTTNVEFLTLNLGNASSGEYKLNISVLDQNTGQRTQRGTSFWIR